MFSRHWVCEVNRTTALVHCAELAINSGVNYLRTDLERCIFAHCFGFHSPLRLQPEAELIDGVKGIIGGTMRDVSRLLKKDAMGDYE